MGTVGESDVLLQDCVNQLLTFSLRQQRGPLTFEWHHAVYRMGSPNRIQGEVVMVQPHVNTQRPLGLFRMKLVQIVSFLTALFIVWLERNGYASKPSTSDSRCPGKHLADGPLPGRHEFSLRSIFWHSRPKESQASRWHVPSVRIYNADGARCSSSLGASCHFPQSSELFHHISCLGISLSSICSLPCCNSKGLFECDCSAKHAKHAKTWERICYDLSSDDSM